jgi:hypothetical protein
VATSSLVLEVVPPPPLIVINNDPGIFLVILMKHLPFAYTSLVNLVDDDVVCS